MRYTVGILLIFLTFAMVILVLGEFHPSVFAAVIDTPSLLPFIVVVSAVIIMTDDFKTKVKAANALFSKRYVLSAPDKEKAISLLQLLSKTVIATAVVMFILGLIFMLGSLENPDQLGPILSVSLVSVFDGAAINLIFILPAIHILKNRPNPEPVSVVISEKQVVDKLLELCYKQGISPEDILKAEEIAFKQTSSEAPS